MSKEFAEAVVIAAVEGQRYCGGIFLTKDMKSEAARIVGITIAQLNFYIIEAKKVTKKLCHIHILVAKRD